MVKVDFKLELPTLYRPSAKAIGQVDVPAFNFLMIDGQGDPNISPDYAQAVQALFSVAYCAKFICKKGPLALDYAVMPLEGLWWADDLTAFKANDRGRWKWTLMIMQPPPVPQATVLQAMDEVARKKSLPALARVRLETWAEGPCAQILHIGPFSEEGPTIERLHAFIRERGQLAGLHHEIYLSDVRRANPLNWKTILRQPMR